MTGNLQSVLRFMKGSHVPSHVHGIIQSSSQRFTSHVSASHQMLLSQQGQMLEHYPQAPLGGAQGLLASLRFFCNGFRAQYQENRDDERRFA
uniref:Uncharacterized protein n=1 Tax=Engystomops pustulosus TaxID=76066 RepID=A0AAV6YNF7_ENGPU|nr:hypothetical protein GDO81_023172 [Engystomops pustulosus]